MAVHNGVIAGIRPFTASRQPSLRTSRPILDASLYDLFGGVEGQTLSIIADAAIRVTCRVQCAADASVRVQRPFVVLADLRQSTGSRVRLLVDTGSRISGVTTIHADVRLRIGPRVTRLADLSQRIGVGAELSADAALKVYRVVLHEDHLIQF